MENLDKHPTLCYHFTAMAKIGSVLQSTEIPSSRIHNNISFNEVNRIKENREYLMAILTALHYLCRQGLALRRKYDDGSPTNYVIIKKAKFKKLFNVMCKSNNRLRELFEKHKESHVDLKIYSN